MPPQIQLSDFLHDFSVSYVDFFFENIDKPEVMNQFVPEWKLEQDGFAHNLDILPTTNQKNPMRSVFVFLNVSLMLL